MLFRVFNAILLVVMIAMAYSAPMINNQEATLIPQLRITCDLLSFQIAGFSSGDSFCAAHCLYLGYKGGYCSSQKVCTCR